VTTAGVEERLIVDQTQPPRDTATDANSSAMTERVTVTYHLRSDAATIEARARAIAVEQSVEMPLAAIDEPTVLSDIVGTVDAIEDLGGGTFAVRIGLALATIGDDPGQFLNMLFGNTSLQDDVILRDAAVPE
jgi:ribulose-bisphosphate carboxylase large chain